MASANTRFSALYTFLFCLFVSLSAADEQYKLSDERIETINGIIARAVADKEDLTNPAVIQSIYNRIGAEMPLTPQEPILQVDLKKLNEEAYARAIKKTKADPEKLKALGLKSGVEIVSVESGKMAEAGAKAGGIITHVNEASVSSPEEVVAKAKKAVRAILVEGVDSNGRKFYFGFGK